MSDPNQIVFNTFARDHKGSPVSCYDDTATCFCSVGIVNRLADIYRFPDGRKDGRLLQAHAKAFLYMALRVEDDLKGFSLEYFHDQTALRHPDIFRRVWQRAIDSAKLALQN